MDMFDKKRRLLVSFNGRENEQTHEGYQECGGVEIKRKLIFPILELDSNVIHEIFSRLPIRSILACKCVCKEFFNLLKFDDPYFAQLHLTKAPATTNLVFQTSVEQQSRISFYMFDLDKGFRASSCSINCEHSACQTTNHLNPDITKQNLPSWFLDKVATVVGECNGLLCLYSNMQALPVYVICNPILGEYVSISYSPSTRTPHSCSISSSFGYSPKSGHYKIIHFAKSLGPFTSSLIREMVVDIHTLGSDSWKRIHDVPHLRFRESFDPLLNGSLHWITESNNLVELLCSLDLENERFTFLPPPPHFNTNYIEEIAWTNIGVFRGSLCLCYVYKNSQFEVLVMKDYGVKESWTKEFSIEINFYSGLRGIDFRHPIKFLKNGKLWLRYSSNRLVSYTPQTRTFKDFDILRQFPYRVILHYPSFISPEHVVKRENMKVKKRVRIDM